MRSCSMLGCDAHLGMSRNFTGKALSEARMASQRNRRPWGTMECSQPVAWITNRSLLVASRARTFPGRPTNCDSTLPRAAHLDSGAIGCNQCIHIALGKCSGISRLVCYPMALSRMLTDHHLNPCPHPTNHSHD